MPQINIKKLPGPKALKALQKDTDYISSCYPRPESRPLYIKKGS